MRLKNLPEEQNKTIMQKVKDIMLLVTGDRLKQPKKLQDDQDRP
jgi:hypothetical protein